MYEDRMKKLLSRMGLTEGEVWEHPLFIRWRARGAETIQQVEMNPPGYLSKMVQAIEQGTAKMGLGFLVGAISLSQLDNPQIKGSSGENALYFLGAVGAAAALKGVYDVISNASCLRDICLHYVTRKKGGEQK